ncbi:MAG: hypothetical protein OIF55_16705 [Amphritea sp.]|nr:hypothetical protein [Amphritea sp.]
MSMLRTKPWGSYPVGTKVYAIGGGHWVKTERGYKWCSGSTFPTPGGDWSHIEEPKQQKGAAQ